MIVRPQAPQRAVLGDLLEEVHVRVEDPREPRRERRRRRRRARSRPRRRRSRWRARSAISCTAVRARLAHVVPGERDRVEARRLGARTTRSGRRRAAATAAAGRCRCRARTYSLSTSFWAVPGSVAAGTPCLPARDDVHRDQHGRRRVDRHRGRDRGRAGCRRTRVSMSASESIATPDPPDLARGPRVVGVEAHLRRQVEGRREAGLALGEQEPEALVGLLGRAEAGVLADRPRPAAVHRRAGCRA